MTSCLGWGLCDFDRAWWWWRHTSLEFGLETSHKLLVALKHREILVLGLGMLKLVDPSLASGVVAAEGLKVLVVALNT